jgi:integrase
MPYKRKGKWLAQVRINDQTKRKTFSTRKEAQEWEVDLKRQSQKSTRQVTHFVCLLEWATSYLEFAQAKFISQTWDEKRSMFKKFFKVVAPDRPVDHLALGDVLSFLQQQAVTRSGYSANKDRKNLVAAWNWGIKYLGLPSPNPCLVDRFPEERQKRCVPPESDFWKVYDVAESNQDRTMLLSYLHLAARRTEIFNLRWEDIDFGESRIRLFTRKRESGSLEYDWLPLTEDLHLALLNHRQASESEWVFPSPKSGLPYYQRNRWMHRLCELAKVKRFGLHGIRHLTASILAKADVSMIDIQSILRHKNLSTTERYIRRLASLRPALRVLSRTKSHQLEPPAQVKKVGNQSK